MTARVAIALFALLRAGGAVAAEPLVEVDAADLRVTQGAVGSRGLNRLRVDSPATRATLAFWTAPRAALRFVYAGPTRAFAPLASGELRQQLGLKLRAANGCNLVYVMWRLSPRAELVVSVKSNPGRATNKECGDRGYTNVAPRWRAPPPRVEAGSEHTLFVDLEGRSLTVLVDGTPRWRGELPRTAVAFDGPVGFRSDNVLLDLALAVPSAPRRPLPSVPRDRADP